LKLRCFLLFAILLGCTSLSQAINVTRTGSLTCSSGEIDSIDFGDFQLNSVQANGAVLLGCSTDSFGFDVAEFLVDSNASQVDISYSGLSDGLTFDELETESPFNFPGHTFLSTKFTTSLSPIIQGFLGVDARDGDASEVDSAGSSDGWTLTSDASTTDLIFTDPNFGSGTVEFFLYFDANYPGEFAPPAPSDVPEPGTLLLLGSGLSAIAGMIRRRGASLRSASEARS